MSREEAAVAYIDVMIGSKGDFAHFCRASDALSEKEKELLWMQFWDRTK